MRLTNDCYLVTLQFNAGAAHYYRDGDAWTKLTTRGRRMRLRRGEPLTP
jgi:hypothetical protein